MKHLKTSISAGCCRIMLIAAGILLYVNVNMLFSQETGSGKMRVYPSFSISAGFFNPGDVNDYISGSFAGSGISTEFGTTDMFANYEIKGAVTFRLKRVDFSGELGYGIAPKWVIVTNGSNSDFYFTRISPGASANYYIPMKSKRMELFFGGGVQYHFMKFENFKGSSPGISLRAGLSLQLGRFNMQPNISFLYAKSKDNYFGYLSEGTFEMNYTSGIIGIIMSFHRPIERN
jgi:hypothetical protein